jgi:peptidoglycan/LPS O-acetylase OafA/YrhL
MWYLLPVIATVLILFIYVASSVPVPEMWNLSREDVQRFRALAPDVQARVVEAVQRSTAITLTLVTIALMGLQIGIYVTAVEGLDRMPWYAEALILGPIALLLLLAFHHRSKLREQIRAAGPQQEDATRRGPEVLKEDPSARRA